jgi:aerobic carbon-monoxide dehydrogenase medium subunit
MIPVQFEYAAPASLEAAVKLLRDNAGALILSGSHSLIAEMKQGNISPSQLIDLSKIDGLRGIKFQADGILRVNVLTTCAQLAGSGEIQGKYSALGEAAIGIGDAQIRNWQTIGDVFAYRDLTSDLPAIALVFDAVFNTLDTEGNHAVKAEEFIAASFSNNWQSREIVTSIDFPPHVSGSGSAYQAFKHPASNHTLCGVAALVQRESNGTVSKCRVAVTGATPRALRLIQVEAAMEGKVLSPENIAAAAKLAGEGVNAIASDRYASAEYRYHLMEVLAKRTVSLALERSSI